MSSIALKLNLGQAKFVMIIFMIKTAIIGLLIFSFIELVIWVKSLWAHRKIFSSIVIFSLPVFNGFLIGSKFNIWTFMILFFSIYRVLNLLRLIEGRTNADYLYMVARRTSILLISWQLMVVGVFLISRNNYSISILFVDSLVFMQSIFILILLFSSLRSFKKTLPNKITKLHSLKDLPSVSVAIPARNESEDLLNCLDSLLTTNYSKLEILVLDDCSQKKYTSQVIKTYAQKGVRFIAGKQPPKGWSSKNYAYQQLLNQASGDILLFCGVDTRFESDTVQLLIETLLKRKKSMLSILPVNKVPKLNNILSVIIQPNRYAWEISIPRRFLNRPPVLSTCWLITSELIKKSGEFKAVANSITPESYFANQAVKDSDGYSFLQSSDVFNLTSSKLPSEQRATAIRTRYPQLHRRPELVSLLTLGELIVLLGPFLMLVYSVVGNHSLILIISYINSILLCYLFFSFVKLTYQRSLIRGIFLMPLAGLFDICLLNYSMYKYEFSEVVWKGRNVCLPVMRAQLNK
ncbi:MAG TPA: glycosyltransferase family 2 protein [Patescibacteria group bacterium]|nr:glycosyltransferase family 2 protein [Patescibacteria group bacterium]